MSVPESTGADDDISVAFRKCWSLGEAFYILENYYDCLFDYSNESDYPKLIRAYQSQIVALNSICIELAIKDSKIEAFVDRISGVINAIILSNFKFNNELHAPINFEVDLESYLNGNLIGKDPRYEHIFRIAKHSMDFYGNNVSCEKNKNLNLDQLKYNILTDLENIKNILSRDKFCIIAEIVNNWTKITDDINKKKLYEKNKLNENVYYDKIKKPGYIEIVNRIRGLVTNTIRIDDLFKRVDRISWALISYMVIIIFFLGIGTLFYVVLDFNPISYFNNSDFSNNITKLVPLMGLFAGLIAGFVKTATPMWQKWSDWITLKIVIWRIKNPDKFVYPYVMGEIIFIILLIFLFIMKYYYF